MPPGIPLFRRISSSIRHRVAKSVEDNPDGVLAKYLWLWQSLGKRGGRSLIPRPLRFFFAASLDLISLVGWYVRTRIRRVARSIGSKEAIMMIYRTNLVAALTIMVGVAIGGGLTLSFLFFSPDEVPAPDPVVVSTPSVEAATPVAVQRGVVTGRITDEQTGDGLFQDNCISCHTSAGRWFEQRWLGEMDNWVVSAGSPVLPGE